MRYFTVVSRKLDGLCARRSSKHVIRDKFFQLKQDGKSVGQSMKAMADDLQCLAGEKAEASEGVAAVRTVPAKRMSRPKERLPGDQEVGAPLCSRCG